MRKAILVTIICFVSLAIVLIACNKDSIKLDQASRNQGTAQSNQNLMTTSGIDVLIFKVELRRVKGTNKDHKPCNCVYCLGFCEFEWFPHFKPSTASIALERDVVNNIATIYFLAPLDDDVEVNPTYYVDEDVLVHDGDGGGFQIESGEYVYTPEAGSVDWEGQSLNYHGKMVVETFD